MTMAAASVKFVVSTLMIICLFLGEFSYSLPYIDDSLKRASVSSHHNYNIINDTLWTKRRQQRRRPSFVVQLQLRGGGNVIPGGYNPFGYKITLLGEEYLRFDGSLDSDVGRFISSLKKRKTTATIKGEWLEVLRNSKSGQSMRIYRKLSSLTDFCLKAGLID